MEDREKSRGPVKVFSFLVTCVFLLLAISMSDGIGTFVSKINTITANLDRAVVGLDTNVTYTDYQDNSEYFSSTTFYSRGMNGLYNLTRMFIDATVKKDILMPGIATVKNHNVELHVEDINSVLNYYKGLFALLLFIALCVILFPVCFLFFCCCRCCGNCGARSQPADKKKDLCKKICQGTLLIILGTGLLFGVVCAFVSNEQLQDGINEFPQNMQNGIKDTGTFLGSTNGQIEHLLVNNYKEFSDFLIDTLKHSTDIVSAELENYSNATAMLNLFYFTDNLGNVEKTLTSLKSNSNRLRVYASQLNDALRKVKKDLLETLNKCKIPECSTIQNDVNTLQTNIDFNKLPDLSQSIEDMSSLGITDIKDAAADGKTQLDNLKNNIKSALDKGTQDAITQIKSSGVDIQTRMADVTKIINDFQKTINDSTLPHINTLDNYINKYAIYRHYIGIGISCVLLLVTVCIALGLICGICGKRPDGYSDNCCNKGTGSQFLICAVALMFLFGFIISVITLASIVVGIASDKIICTTLRNPDPLQSNVMQLIDDLISFDDIDIKPSKLITQCHQNKSAYETFNLAKKFDIAEIRKQFDISKQLDQFNIDDSMFDDFHILNDSNKAIIEKLKTFNPPDLDKFSQELEANFTNYSLTELSDKLREIINLLNEKTVPNRQDLIQNLELSILHLNTYNEKILSPLKDLANVVVSNADSLNVLLKMNHSSFNEAVTSLLSDIEAAEDFLNHSGKDKLTNIVSIFKDSVVNVVNGYLDRVEEHITNKTGNCAPLSNVINGALTSTCDKILLPWNGFWFSLLWSVILYIVTIIVAVKLANLYQKYKPYGHGYVETGGKRGKKKGKKPKRYEERPSNVGHGAVARGSHPADGRYDDMAPKMNYANPLANHRAGYETSTKF